MRPSLFFGAFEPLHETPEVCDVCKENPPVLRYEFASYGTRGEAEEKKGFCCAHCTSILVRILEGDESQRWAEEEAALKDDESDGSDFKQQRLAAFTNNEHHSA
jgi:hypothetical protein